jgi:glycosyltransferase involved in cell wall biosynthesis
MRYAWDQEQAYFPRRHGPVARLRGQVLSWLRTWDVASAGRVDRYVANSHFVADRIRRYYGREAEVLAPPVDTDFYSPGAGSADREYCLAVAALAPYKRVEVAIAACEELGRELIVVGTGPERERLERLAGPRARLLGGVSAERLRELYRGATCFVQPGIEDFGIAAAESLACGTPVVAFGRGGVCDIVEDGAHGVLYGPDDDPASMASAIDKCARIGFNKMKLRSRAELYSAPVFRQRLQDLLLSSRPDLEEAFA